MRFDAVPGTGAGLGRTRAGRTLVADRPDGVAGGTGLGFNGGELLAAALGGCFWNDLHYASAAMDTPVVVDSVEVDTELAGQPPRVIRAHIRARLSGAPDAALQAVFDAAAEASTIANSLTGRARRQLRTPASGRRPMTQTIRLTAAQALVRYLTAQLTETGEPFIAGVWAIFGHGNVAGIGEALHASRDAIPTWRGHNEQTMCHAALAYTKQLGRSRAMAVTSSIGPGATNMVTAAALAHVNRLPILLLPGDVFANRAPDPVLQQIEDFGDGTVSANDCFRPVSRYFDRITRPEQLLTALPRAFRTMTDPADCGPVTLALCQDVQAEAYDYPAAFFEPRTWHRRRPGPTRASWRAAAEAIAAARRPVIVAGGGVHYSGATDALRVFAESHSIPVVETQAGKSALPWDHELNLGPVGVTGSTSANEICAKADLVLGIGTRLQDFTTGSWSLFRSDVPLVCLNVAAYDAAKHGALPLQADAMEGIAALDAALGTAHGRRRLGRAEARVVRSGRPADRGAEGRQCAAHRCPSDRRGAAGGRPRHRGHVRRRHHAGRVAQAVEGRAADVLPHGIRLFLHGLRDRRRARHQDGRAGSRRDLHARRRVLHDGQFRAGDRGDDGAEDHRRDHRQPRLRLHQPSAAGHRRGGVQQPSRPVPTMSPHRTSTSPPMPARWARARCMSARSPSWRRRWRVRRTPRDHSWW